MRVFVRSIIATVTVGAVALGLLLTATSVTRAGHPAVKLDSSGVIYTADEHGNSISVIDLASGKVTTVSVPISPHNVQITADGAQLLAVGEIAVESHSHGRPDAGHGAKESEGRLLVFDAGNMRSGPLASVQVGSHPAHVVVDRETRRAFVTNSGDNAVAVVDLAEKRVVRTIATGRSPHGLRISPDARDLYVANVGDGSLSVIDAEKLVEVTRIPVGRTPVQVGFTPDGTRVYVSLRDENSVAIVDTASRTKIGTVVVGRGPIQLHATPDGRSVYVANQGSNAEPADTVSVIDVVTGRVLDTVPTGRGAHGVAVSSDGTLVFITNIVEGTVSTINTSTRTVIATFHVGRGPNGITYRPRGLRQAHNPFRGR